MADTIIRIAAAHGFAAFANTDGSVDIEIPTTRNGEPAETFIEVVRTIDETYAALGY